MELDGAAGSRFSTLIVFGRNLRSTETLLYSPECRILFYLVDIITTFRGFKDLILLEMALRHGGLRGCCWSRSQKWIIFVYFLFFVDTASGQIRYSIPEEMKKGSLIGNVAQDLGLDLKRLRSGRARILTGESPQYADLKTDKGILVVKERMDREQLCGDVTPCSLSFEIILENPIELHRVIIEILDINDHTPAFKSGTHIS